MIEGHRLVRSLPANHERMSIIGSLYSTVLDSLFPISAAEREVLGMEADAAWKILPRARNFPVREACSVFAYKDERVWRLIWSLKYKKSRRAAEIGAYSLYHIIRRYSDAAGRIFIVPMPITNKRRRERGFNQCELLTDALEKMDINSNFSIIRKLLIRTGHKSRQTLKDRSERLESAHDIFAVNEKTLEEFKILIKGNDIKDCLIFIVDDVITTGSTIKDAVETMRRAGLERTYGISVAH